MQSAWHMSTCRLMAPGQSCCRNVPSISPRGARACVGIVLTRAQITKEKQQFQRVVVTRDEALAMFQENKFKVEIISALAPEATITLYRCGPMVRSCFHLPAL